MLRNAFINASLDDLISGNDQLFYYKENGKLMDWFDNDKLHVRNVGWWQDKWGFVSKGGKTMALCHIKGNGLTNTHWKELTIMATLSGVNNYLQRAITFLENLGTSINHQSINDWLHVFTAYYNYCLPNEGGKTPAQLMGFFDRPMGLSELLNGVRKGD